MHNKHAWHDRTEDGSKRLVEATKFAGKWKIKEKIAGDEFWETQEPPVLADLETLHELLQNKYQRRRASYEDVKGVEQLIAQHRG